MFFFSVSLIQMSFYTQFLTQKMYCNYDVYKYYKFKYFNSTFFSVFFYQNVSKCKYIKINNVLKGSVNYYLNVKFKKTIELKTDHIFLNTT